MKNILVLSDNEQILFKFKKLIKAKQFKDVRFNYFFSINNDVFLKKYHEKKWIKPINVNELVDVGVIKYDLIFSLHCLQIFPQKLVQKIKCINIHPGYNPFNRGWYPHVFSMMNGLPCGATIHEMDEKLDHGPIIAQKEIKIEASDTSLTYYERILAAEIELLNNNLEKIINNNYNTIIPKEGNLNYKKDFINICKLAPDHKDTFLNHINKLRALSHGHYLNAYIVDHGGNKIYIKLDMIQESKDKQV
jgi:dTDP-4-amino-4,6-dideoxyglucose formyltransferase